MHDRERLGGMWVVTKSGFKGQRERLYSKVIK